MFTDDGQAKYNEFAQWVSDENYMFSPNFVPTEETPAEAIEYYKYMLSDLVDFDAPGFEWPTGIGVNF